MNTEDFAPEIELLVINDITPSPMNPRKTFNEEEIGELAENIRKQGLLQPITVRPMIDEVVDGMNITRPASGKVPSYYEIVCGERRYRACKKLGLFEIAAIVREMSDDEAFDAMITENLQRRDVDPIEEAVAFRLLLERGQTADELAARFGKSIRYIQDRMRLGSLIEPLRRAVSAGQIPIRGGYLLARLSEDDQKEFLNEEFGNNGIEDGDDMTVSDIEDWLDRHFLNLWRAPFHDGSTLKETWNPDGRLIRRCYDCEGNTCNHGCLFADMQTKEPQCIDAVCYERKLQIYYEYLIERDKKLILAANEKLAPGRVAIIGDEGDLYNEGSKERFKVLKDKVESQGFAVISAKKLSRVWGDNAEKEFQKGRAIRCINLTDMARGWKVKPEYYRLPGGTSQPGTSNYPSQLVERSAAVKSQAEKKIVNYAKKNFDRDKYVARTAPLEEWEKDIIAAIIFAHVPYTEHSDLIPNTSYRTPTYEELHNFCKQQASFGNAERWMRRAIAKYITETYHETYFAEAISQLDPLAQPFISKVRREADKHVQDIREELHELGYDEKGNKL